jgi:lysophospholipase L1-like esterase
LTRTLAERSGFRASGGFRGLWGIGEWSKSGTWTRAMRTDPFDVAPFGRAWFSSGVSVDELRWLKPAATQVTEFDIYWFDMPGAGAWQYRIDDRGWENNPATAAVGDNKLHKLTISEPVARRLLIRGFDGARPCIAPIAGISVRDRPSPRAPVGPVVHNLGCPGDFLLGSFCRPSAGDPLALLEDLQPDLVTVLFSNDVVVQKAARFGDALRNIVERVHGYADVVLIAPFEQRPHRRVTDAITIGGSDSVRSSSASFRPTEVDTPVQGTNVPRGTTIVSVVSPGSARLSRAATGSCDGGELTIGLWRDAEQQAIYRATAEQVASSMGCAFLDLYDAWAALAGAGWDAAYAQGLMLDALHPSQRGHDDIARRVEELLGVHPS